MPTQTQPAPELTTPVTETQELPTVTPQEPEFHSWWYQETSDGLSYQHEFGQALTERAATDRILKLHGLKEKPEGAKVWHEERKLEVESAPAPAPETPAPAPEPTPENQEENPVG